MWTPGCSGAPDANKPKETFVNFRLLSVLTTALLGAGLAQAQTELVIATMTSCKTAVIPRPTSEIFTARIPRALRVSASSIESA